MTREEMLNILHNINPGVELVALTSEHALERTFVCGRGFAYEWVSFDEPWPAIRISDLTNIQLSLIKDKLRNKSLSKDDLKSSQLLSMFEEYGGDTDICDACIGLQDIDLENDLFVLCNIYADEPTYTFYSDYALFVKDFEEKYIHVDTEWQELNDENLISWINRLEYEFSDIPLREYDVN